MSWRSCCSAMSAAPEKHKFKRRLIPNDKLNFPADDMLNIMLAALAAGLCAAIDYVLEEEENK